VVQAPPAAAVPSNSGKMVLTAFDSDMPQTGTATPIILAPPPSNGSGTSIC
jgi:hypothetical protein